MFKTKQKIRLYKLAIYLLEMYGKYICNIVFIECELQLIDAASNSFDGLLEMRFQGL